MSKYIGIVSVIVNGKKLNSQKGAALKLGGMKRSPVLGTHGVVGYFEEPQAAEISCTLNLGAADDEMAVNNLTDGTGTFMADNGKTWVVGGLFCDGDGEVKDGGGGMSVKLIGQAAKKA